MKQSNLSAFFGAKPVAKAAEVVEADANQAKKKLATDGSGAVEAGSKREAAKPSAGRLKRLRRAGDSEAKENKQEANGLPKELEEEEEAVGEGVAVQDVTKEAPNVETTKSPGKEKEEENKEEVAEEEEEEKETEEVEAVKVHPMFAPKSDVTAAAAKETATADGGKVDKRTALGGKEAESGATEAFEAMLRATAERASKVKSTKDGVGAAAIAAAEQHRKYSADVYISWASGVPVPYSFMAQAFEVVANTTKRQEKTSVLIEAFRAILTAGTAEDLIAAVRLTANELSPPHEGLELGLGEATLKDVLAEVSGKNKAAVERLLIDCGDLGSLAVEVRSKVRVLFKSPRLTLKTVLKSLREIAGVEGTKAIWRKKGMVSKLLVASQGNEPGYIIRACELKRGLRIGVNDSILLTALAHAVHLHKRGATGAELADALEGTAQAVRQAFSECPSFEILINAMLDHDLDDLPQHCHFKIGVPVKPMLAKPTNGVSEVLDKFSDCEFTCEYKYDGERAQIHVLEDGSVQVYSRSSESSIGKYPDAAEIIKRHLRPGVHSIVIDSEVVGFDRVEGRIKPFQELSRRPRKVNPNNRNDLKADLCVFPFDCLYVNGEVLLHKTLADRRKALHESLRETFGECSFAKSKTSSALEELQAFLDEAVTDCTEGLMVKAMDATYEPSKRSLNWLKLKKDYMEGAADSFDVVPIGAWYGKGKRTGVYGSFLLAVYDPDSENYQTISKIGTGFSEEVLRSLSEKLRDFEISEPRNYYKYGDSAAMRPEVWFEAKLVWEVKAADLSISPIHQAALGRVESGKGISIRFPRLVKERDDKGPEDATTAEQVAEMYGNQAVAKAQAKPPAEDE